MGFGQNILGGIRGHNFSFTEVNSQVDKIHKTNLRSPNFINHRER